MKQLTTREKIENGIPIVDSQRMIKFKEKISPILLGLSKSKISYDVICDNDLVRYENVPSIYVVNHSCFQDTPIVCNCIKDKAYILAGKQELEFLDNIFFRLYGSIFVDRKDKNDMSLSKDVMEKYIEKGVSLIVFPEATWNLSEELLMLPMKWGIIDIAKNTGAQIIPILLKYDKSENQCHVKYYDPILIDEAIDKKEAINNIRDMMATDIWNDMLRFEQLKRTEIDVDYLREKMLSVIDEYPKLDFDYEQSVVFKPYPSPDEVYEPIKKLKLTKDNAFLFNKNNKGMR